LTTNSRYCIIDTTQEKKERTMENDLLYMARSLGFEGESREDLNRLCDEHKVSDDMREKMVKEYEEGYFDW
jgi:hypothetical protein